VWASSDADIAVTGELGTRSGRFMAAIAACGIFVVTTQTVAERQMRLIRDNDESATCFGNLGEMTDDVQRLDGPVNP
jgi:hypothetical protein